MSALNDQTVWLHDPRIAEHALAPTPAWLWSLDAQRVLWANPTAAAIFDADSSGALSQQVFEPDHSATAQVKRLADTLPQGGTKRLERLNAFGAPVGSLLTCLCSRIQLADNSNAILIVATERAGRDFSLPERARRLLADLARPAAVFTADGELIEATIGGRQRLDGKVDLIALGAQKLAREATINGKADGEIDGAGINLLKLGAGATITLLVTFTTPMTLTAPAPAEGGGRSSDFVALPVAVVNIGSDAVQRRAPFRFVWQMDSGLHFTQGLENFARVIGPETASVLARSWPDIAQTLQIDSDGALAQALASRTTWSGIVVLWPVDHHDRRVAIEMSGLPVFDRDRQFAGYRGFGICRDMDRASGADNASRPPQLTQDNSISGAAYDTTAITPNNVTPFIAQPLHPVREAKVLAFRPQTAEPPVPPETFAPAIVPTMTPELPHHSAPVEIAPPDVSASAPPLVFQEPVAPATPPQQEPVPPTPVAETPVQNDRSAFEELARELNARLKGNGGSHPPLDDDAPDFISQPLVVHAPAPPPAPATRASNEDGRAILDRLPMGVLVYRLNNLLYANRAFLDWTGYENLNALTEAGGLDSLFIENGKSENNGSANGKSLTITTVNGQQKAVQGKLLSVPWMNDSAMALFISTHPVEGKVNENSLRRLESESREMRAILDTATDGVLVLDRAGRVLSANRSAEALFGYDGADFTELAIGDLFAPESRRSVMDYLDRLAVSNATYLLDGGREVIGRVRQGGLVPLFVTMGRIEDGDKFCAVLRDVTAWKRTEEELINARREAEKNSTAKSEFLAKISHEIRTPLNAIIGFSEVMMDERFGAIGNDRYKQYLKDIHTSGGHLVSLLNDLLDLSKIEAGKLELTFVSVNLNDIIAECVAIMQQEANRERVIIRTSLPANLPPIVADVRSVRQIALNILSNSIKFTGAGGQVIVSTAVNDDNEASLRVRDTGAGMSEQELQMALEPFRQLATSSRWGASGTGLGLPITKALAEANHARFRITSRPDEGTLVEVAFPATRVLAE